MKKKKDKAKFNLDLKLKFVRKTFSKVYTSDKRKTQNKIIKISFSYYNFVTKTNLMFSKQNLSLKTSFLLGLF